MAAAGCIDVVDEKDGGVPKITRLDEDSEMEEFQRRVAPWFYEKDPGGEAGFCDLDAVLNRMLLAAQKEEEGDTGLIPLPLDVDVVESVCEPWWHQCEHHVEDQQSAAEAAERARNGLDRFARTVNFTHEDDTVVATMKAVRLNDPIQAVPGPKFQYTMTLPMLYEVALPECLRKTATLYLVVAHKMISKQPSLVATCKTTCLVLKEWLPQMVQWAGCFFMDGLPDVVEVVVGGRGKFAQFIFESDDSTVRLVVKFTAVRTSTK